MNPVYVATINIPGYLPEREPVAFHDPREAWAYLAGERMHDEDCDDDAQDYSDACDIMYDAGQGEIDFTSIDEPHFAPDGAGALHLVTPGYDGDHDLGLVYRVARVEHADYPHHPGYLHDCQACETMCHCDGEHAQCVYEGEHEL